MPSTPTLQPQLPHLPGQHRVRWTGRHALSLLGAACLWAAATGNCGAQPVYRVVGPDGKVTFTDRPPAQTGSDQVANLPTAGSSKADTTPAADAGVPASLKPVVRKYPVTLYTTNTCAPCDQGRTLLKARGVPFTEKTVNTSADHAAFQKAAPNASGFPLLMVGSQTVPGYAAGEWGSYLDAAGYPKTSALPANYQTPAAQPIAPPKPVDPNAATAAAAAGATADAAAAETAPTPQRRPRPVAPAKRPDDNPAGIRF